MADDLEDFLRKAAERRAARQRSGAGNASQSSSTPPKPTPPKLTPIDQRHDAPIILTPLDEEPTQAAGNQLGRLQPHVPPEQHLAREIDQADERMNAHLHQAFDHEVSRLDKSKKKKKQDPKKRSVSSTATPTIASKDQSDSATAYDYESTRTVPQSNRSMIGSTSDLVTILRNPQSLKLAFIASEIFKRKFE